MTPWRRVAVVVFVLAPVLLAVALVALLSQRLPDGTTTGSLAVRAGIALLAGGALVLLVRRMMWALASPAPPPPPTIDARVTDVVYECLVCGTRLRLEVASTGKAPKHCGEEMESKLAT